MTKLLLLVLVGVGFIAWLKSQNRPRVDPPPAQPGMPEDMVRCRVCGINLPRSEAILSRGKTYCSDEHRRQDQG